MDIQTHLGKFEHLLVDFANLMPFATGLQPDAVYNQILSSPIIPTFDIVSEQLLHLSTLHAFGDFATPSNDFGALASHCVNHGGWGGNCGDGRSGCRCNYCNYYDLVEAKCRTKAKEQSIWPRLTTYLAYYCLFVFQSFSLGPWILDFGASDHMTSNKSFFFHLSILNALLLVTLANANSLALLITLSFFLITLINVPDRRLEQDISLEDYINFHYWLHESQLPPFILLISTLDVLRLVESIQLYVISILSHLLMIFLVVLGCS
ncbi:hypothetical protein CR513_40200, partial [Mucuna pruriens]